MRSLVWAACVVLAAGGCSGGSDGDSATTTTSSTNPKPVIGFDFSDALGPGIDPSVEPPAILVPECFGGVTRVALVREDMRETLWEVAATDPSDSPMLERVSLGIAPDGFETVVPLAEGVPPKGFIVLNGPDNIGLLVVKLGGLSVQPTGCD